MKLLKRVMSLLLAAVLLLGMFPAIQLTAAAATTVTSNYALDHMDYRILV